MFRARGCTPEEAADLAQDAAVRAFVHIRRWGVNGTGLDPLLNRIARNLLIDRYRRTTPHIVPLDDAGELQDPDQDPTEEVVRRQRSRAVRSAIQGLPVRHQTAITYSLNGLTPEEVGRRMGIGRNAADALLHRARRSLKERLQTVGEGMFGVALGIRVRWDHLTRRAGGGGGATEALRSTTLASGFGALAATVAVVAGMTGAGAAGGGGVDSWRAPMGAVASALAGQSAAASAAVAPSAAGGSSLGADGEAQEFGSLQLGPASRSPGSGGGSTTNVNGPENGNGTPLFEGTIRNYGTTQPPDNDPVARTVVRLGDKLCTLPQPSCGGS